MRPANYAVASAEIRQTVERSVAQGALSLFAIDSRQTGVAERPSLLGRLAKSWRRHTERRQAVDALSAFDDRMLDDLGIHRAEIPAVVSGQAARRA